MTWKMKSDAVMEAKMAWQAYLLVFGDRMLFNTRQVRPGVALIMVAVRICRQAF